MTNVCLFCGCVQGLVSEVTSFYCERCGAKNLSDGSCLQPDMEESRGQQDFYDHGDDFRDRESYERSQRRR